MWRYIEAANWAQRSQESKGYEAIKIQFMTDYTKELNMQIRAFADERFGELDDLINAYEREHCARVGQYGGDDSYSDMIYHVIGLGQKYFDEVMADATVLNDLHFVEAFNYGLPYETDFHTLDAGYHKKRALDAISAISDIMLENDPSAEDIETMRQMLNRFMFMAAGIFGEAVRGFNDARYKEYYQFKSNSHHAMFSNYLNDVKQFEKLIK